MPVFRTKMMASILDPVAQQVSQLVILHEEAEDGNAIPDLSSPVALVATAVDNLIKVVKETTIQSKDEILKQDMPPAMIRVEQSTTLLIEATNMLKADPISVPARKKLIDGSRGILQGTSALLLAYDESEVRKIIKVCKGVLEYLAVNEVIDSMEDLLTYVKNLTPGLTAMARQIDARQNELTHQVHRDMLIRSLEIVKQTTPTLISSIKIYISTKQQGGRGLADSQENRNYLASKMSSEIQEIIRVLQLTTYDEEEWDGDDVLVMTKAKYSIDYKFPAAMNWLQDPEAVAGSSAEKSLRQIVAEARRIADICVLPEDRDVLMKACGDITTMANTLAELRYQGKGSSPQAMAVAKSISEKLKELQAASARAVSNTEKTGIARPANTVSGKIEQAQRWLTNPHMDDGGVGEQAARMVVIEGRKLADRMQHGAQKQALLEYCDGVERLTNQLSELCRRGLANTPDARNIAMELSQKLQGLKLNIQDSLINKVGDDFMDVLGTVKQLERAALAPTGAKNRDGDFHEKAINFQRHADAMVHTAKLVASSGGGSNKKTLGTIYDSALQLNDLTPQVVHAANIVLMNPGNEAVYNHFNILKQNWEENANLLRNHVDSTIDTASFIKSQEEQIMRESEFAEMNFNSPAGFIPNTSKIARRANHVVQIATQEVDNSDDPVYTERVNDTVTQLKGTIQPMIERAKEVAQNPGHEAPQQYWRGANRALISAVGHVHRAIMVYPQEAEFNKHPDDRQHYAGDMPDMNNLHISPQQHGQVMGAAAGYGPDGTSHHHHQQQQHHGRRPDIDQEAILHQTRKVLEASQQGVDSVAPPTPPPPHNYNPYANDGATGYDFDQNVPSSLSSYSGGYASPSNEQSHYHGNEVTPGDNYGYSGYYSEHAPPRPPLPRDTAPPRPPPPETDDEDEANFPIPQANQPIMMAAHALHLEAKQWSSKDNEIIAAAKRMALLMAKLSQLVRGEGGGKKDLIACAKMIAESSEVVTSLAKELARECTDRRMRTNLLQVCERIPTIGTQLKILSTVKATMLGAQGSEEDQEATEMLVGNAQNLMQSVRETVRAAEAASIKIRVESGYSIRWHRRQPWYTA
ncbi:vinculin-like isoform X2 [Tubulanus polymorphus]|uniref:vinculin-like isoform X2 n=1 Tax=Tubulanus polymorphus TaxID=672921 RepID=UPI003DA3719E